MATIIQLTRNWPQWRRDASESMAAIVGMGKVHHATDSRKFYEFGVIAKEPNDAAKKFDFGSELRPRYTGRS